MRTGGGGVGTQLGMELEDAGSNCDTVAQKTVPMFGHFVMFGS